MTVIYTCQTNNTSQIVTPYIDKRFTYYAFTNQRRLPRPWIKIPIKKTIDEKKQQRYYKINSHLFFKKNSVYVDSHVKIHKHLLDFSHKMLQYKNYSTLVHPFRTCFLDELYDWFILGLINLQQVDNITKKFYKNIKKSYLCCVLIRKYSNETVRTNSSWWKTFLKFNIRDQLPLILVNKNINTFTTQQICLNHRERSPSSYMINKEPFLKNFNLNHFFTQTIERNLKVKYTIPNDIIKNRL